MISQQNHEARLLTCNAVRHVWLRPQDGQPAHPHEGRRPRGAATGGQAHQQQVVVLLLSGQGALCCWRSVVHSARKRQQQQMPIQGGAGGGEATAAQLEAADKGLNRRGSAAGSLARRRLVEAKQRTVQKWISRTAESVSGQRKSESTAAGCTGGVDVMMGTSPGAWGHGARPRISGAVAGVWHGELFCFGPKGKGSGLAA
jgi:hypothetical protein